MDQYIIKGGKPLVGEVDIEGAKNAALGILAGAVMADEPVVIENIPDVNDVNVLLEAIAGIGYAKRFSVFHIYFYFSVLSWCSSIDFQISL